MGAYVAPPPDSGALPAAFRAGLPVDPQADARLEAGIDRGIAQVRLPPKDLKHMVDHADELEGGVMRAGPILAALKNTFGENWQAHRAFPKWYQQASEALVAWPKLHGAGFLNLPETLSITAFIARFNQPAFTWTVLAGVVWGVHYCTDEQRREYRVNLGTVMTRGPRDDAPFDSDQLVGFLGAKANVGFGGAGGTLGSCIWVVDDLDLVSPNFYTHICMLGRFHHTSFLAGGDIAAGGEWQVKAGKLVHITGASGHYQPQKWRLLRALDALKGAGVIVDRTPTVGLYRRDGALALVPCLDVLNDRPRFEDVSDFLVCPPPKLRSA